MTAAGSFVPVRTFAAAATVGDVFIAEELAVNASCGPAEARLSRIVDAGGLTPISTQEIRRNPPSWMTEFVAL